MSGSNKIQVQLGYPCDELPHKDDVDVYMDKIGGQPIWFDSHVPPPSEWASCGHCTAPLLLVSQIVAQRGPKKDRVYYVLGCNRRECMGQDNSWRVIKAIKQHKPKKSRRSKKKGTKNASAAPDLCEDSSLASIASKETVDATNESDAFFPKTPETKRRTTSTPFSPPRTPNVSTPASLPPTPSFGDISFGSPFTPGSGGLASPARSITELLARRDKKYARNDDEDDVEQPATAPKPSNAERSAMHNHSKAKKEKAKRPTASENSQSSTTEQPAHPEDVDEVSELAVKLESSLQLDNSNESSADAWTKAPALPVYPLAFEAEPPEENSFEYEMRLYADYQRLEREQESGAKVVTSNVDVDGLTWSGEAYEKTGPKFFRKAFKRFQKAVEEAPEQCLRYAFDGPALFYNDDETSLKLQQSGPAPCPRCKGPRVYEFQLMPMILSLLPTEQYVPELVDNDPKARGKSASPTDLAGFLERYAQGMEWGTVLIYCCKQDCEANVTGNGKVGITYSEEYIAVQRESLVSM
ncbi:hypothetical protein HDU85_002927 [Gaertneriomyces sp. JEL0708]|nr:hypothetical protein HDU85_002927 [Gaertneriomyces sp. JEL0708]